MGTGTPLTCPPRSRLSSHTATPFHLQTTKLTAPCFPCTLRPTPYTLPVHLMPCHATRNRKRATSLSLSLSRKTVPNLAAIPYTSIPPPSFHAIYRTAIHPLPLPFGAPFRMTSTVQPAVFPTATGRAPVSFSRQARGLSPLPPLPPPLPPPRKHHRLLQPPRCRPPPLPDPHLVGRSCFSTPQQQ